MHSPVFLQNDTRNQFPLHFLHFLETLVNRDIAYPRDFADFRLGNIQITIV